MTKQHDQVLLVGTGPMAIEHAKVLKALGQNFIAIGRGQESAKKFEESTGVNPVTGGIYTWLESNKIHARMPAVVAVSEEELGNVTIALIKNGFKKILVEKPGGFDSQQIKEIAQLSEKNSAKIYIAYNRRSYASVKRAQQFIKEDGGVTSFNFEFTEWSHVIAPLKKAPGVKERWFLHNSTHVIDLAFFLGGFPKHLTTFVHGSLPWHPEGSIFAGAGISTSGALFSYQANWEAPGRWGVEILTKKRRLIFRPMESLQVQQIGSVKIEPVEIDTSLDTNFKPGLYLQMETFLSESPDLCIITEQSKHVDVYDKFLKNQSS